MPVRLGRGGAVDILWGPFRHEVHADITGIPQAVERLPVELKVMLLGGEEEVEGWSIRRALHEVGREAR